ncbi:hypothetical protein N7485_009649 [Penicillium canescens]|nr:hypothetical protein N7485_009649 [Penicillium canescens]
MFRDLGDTVYYPKAGDFIEVTDMQQMITYNPEGARIPRDKPHYRCAFAVWSEYRPWIVVHVYFDGTHTDMLKYDDSEVRSAVLSLKPK